MGGKRKCTVVQETGVLWEPIRTGKLLPFQKNCPEELRAVMCLQYSTGTHSLF